MLIFQTWIKTLRLEHPVIAFKSSLAQPSKGPGVVTKCIGIQTLLATLKKLNQRNENLKVGVVGKSLAFELRELDAETAQGTGMAYIP